MKNKFLGTIISTVLLASPAFADYAFVDPSDFTGDALFSPPSFIGEPVEEKTVSSGEHAIPPIKKVRMFVKKKLKNRDSKKYEFAPVEEQQTDDIYAVETDSSEFASQELKEEFEDMMPDGFEADEEAVREQKKFGHFLKRKKDKKDKTAEENTENIILDCDNVDYDTETYAIVATGNVEIEFVKQGTKLYADVVTYDRANNTVKAEGNVKIVKNSQTVTGDYIFVDMNEESALIENPVTETATIEIKARKGYVYGDRIVQEDGSLNVNQSFKIDFQSATRGPQMKEMLYPKDKTLTKDMKDGRIRIKVKDIKITQKGDLEVLAVKRAKIFKGERKILAIPALKVYTNRTHDYGETNSWEVGSYRDLGMYIGPGFVFELPKGSVLKAIPMLNYNHRIGVGAIGRFSSGTNLTQAAYGTAKSKFLLRGKQQLDDNLNLYYGINDYMNEWFLGRRRPKYGATLAYDKSYTKKDFLLKDQISSYQHRFDIGYYQDINTDKHYGELAGNEIGTTRFRYMAQVNQSFYNYVNEEEQKAVRLDFLAQLSAAVYGTGDTQVIGRIGPLLHTQYKRWMQDLGYYQSVSDDNSPIPVFDAYRYGKSNMFIREYLRLNNYLTVVWVGSVCLAGETYNDKLFQENSFYLSIGPNDVKFNIGYDFVRENTFFTVAVMMDACGTKVDYDKLEIKQDKKAKKTDNKEEEENDFVGAPTTPVLRHAVVEDVKTEEDVL